SHVLGIGAITAAALEGHLGDARARAEGSEVRCADAAAAVRMTEAIMAAQREGDSLGGLVEVIAWGAPAGLGGYAEWDLRLDGRIAQALLSIPSCKAV